MMEGRLGNMGWNELEIDRSDLKLKRMIIEFSLVSIHEGVLRCGSTSTRVVAKIEKSRTSNFLHEAKIMKNLNSHHIVKLIGVITVEKPFCIVTEFMALGDLKRFLRSHNPDYQQILQMCGEIADGMAYLSDQNIVHRDLAARNCLVGEDMTVKVGGLHRTRKASEEDYREFSSLIPMRWMAPESLKDRSYTMKSDVWSYGVVLWEIVTFGENPYPGLADDEVRSYVLSGRTMKPETVDPKMYKLMTMCWKFKPSERPTFLDVIEILEPDLEEKFHEVSYFHSEERKVPDDFAHDPYAIDLYRKALIEGKEVDRSIRINIVGNFKQGKTCLVRRLVGESVEGVQSTNGIEVDRYKCQRENDGTFSYIRKETLDDSEISNRLVIVARETTMHQGSELTGSNTTLEPLEDEVLELTKYRGGIEKTVLYDGSDETFDTIKLETSAKRNQQSHVSSGNVKQQKSAYLMEADFKSFQDSLKSNNSTDKDKNVTVSFDIWDFGGQHTFYATHTIFHSRKAIYLLVFNLSLSLQERVKDESEDMCLLPRNRDMSYYIRFWMNSIHSFVGNGKGTEPPVILVGTHKDMLHGNEEAKQSLADHYFCDVRDLFEETQVINHIRPEDFAVDNTDKSNESIRQLREEIIHLGEARSKAVSIPAKWMQLEKVLIKNRTRKIISLETVLAMDAENEFPISDIEQVKLFLKYHHNKGTLCYFDEEPISNDVVLDPQYLIDAFKCIITSGIFCKKDIEMRTFWKKLLNEAKLEHTLIDRVWGREKDKEFAKHKRTIIAFLKKHHVLSEAMKYDPTKQSSEGLGWYLVPSLLRNHYSETDIFDFLYGKQQNLARYVLTFGSSPVVPTIYHRVIAAAIGKWPVAQFRGINLIYENLSALRLDKYHDGLIQMNNNHIELSVVSLCPSLQVSTEVADILRRFVESVVEHEFSKLRDPDDEVKKPYVTNFRCNHPSHRFPGSIKFIEVFQQDNRKILPCPDSVSHEIVIKKVLSEWIEESERLQNIPKQRLSEKYLSKFAQAVGGDWELLGLELGLTSIEIEHIAADNPNSVIMRIYKMLTNWNLKLADKATMDVLVQAIRNCQSVAVDAVSVDWDIIKNVTDEIRSSQ